MLVLASNDVGACTLKLMGRIILELIASYALLDLKVVSIVLVALPYDTYTPENQI